MNIVIFGSGPMPRETSFPVLAPGARTWQITQTVATALSGTVPSLITVFGLETARRVEPVERVPLQTEIAVNVEINYVPLVVEDYLRIPFASSATRDLGKVDAVIGCASIQPCASAAQFAKSRHVPFWADMFGDPFAEIQSKAELFPQEKEANDARYLHNWQLCLAALLQGDVFSSLSERQRYSVIGQLGAAGRLNRLTSGTELVHSIPFGLYPNDAPELMPPPAKPHFVVMWCGSFNTWMDVDALVGGISLAVAKHPDLRFLIVGGEIAKYNEAAYEKFREGIQQAACGDAVKLGGWQPLSELRKLYSVCDVGLSIDRFTYEAVLGSRTRIVNFLGAGKPVISTNLTELTEDLAKKGFVIPFKIGDAVDLSRALGEAMLRRDEMEDLGQRGRRYVLDHFGGAKVGAALMKWIRAPQFAGDKQGRDNRLDFGNPLASFWQKA